MNIDELISMNIGDKVINGGHVWILESVDRRHEPDTTLFYFCMVNAVEYKFSIQLTRSWKYNPIHFRYDCEDSELNQILDPYLKDTIIYSKQEHIKLYKEKISENYKKIFYYTNKIIELESE